MKETLNLDLFCEKRDGGDIGRQEDINVMSEEMKCSEQGWELPNANLKPAEGLDMDGGGSIDEEDTVSRKHSQEQPFQSTKHKKRTG
jgi:hypothetical protein